MRLVVRGAGDDLAAWRTAILPRLRSRQSACFIPADAVGLPDELAKQSSQALPAAWICEGFSCRAPIADLDSLIAELEGVDA